MYPQLIKNGRIIRPVMGFEAAPEQWALQSGIEGLPILRVFNNSPAQEAGLQGVSRNNWGQLILGDVIVAINGKLTPTNDAFMSIMEKHKPGDQVEIQIVRGGKVQKALAHACSTTGQSTLIFCLRIPMLATDLRTTDILENGSKDLNATARNISPLKKMVQFIFTKTPVRT
ncbi:MAG: PDZ domain-containing protein [Rhizobium sp.]|nr:PDZ domain-containing protein [Rhizobium sp.]